MSHPLEKEIKALETAAQRLITTAVKGGATAAEVCGTYGRNSKITLEKQDYHLASHDDGYQLGLRVLNQDRQGFTSCNTLEESELRATALKAIEIVGFSPGNPFFRILLKYCSQISAISIKKPKPCFPSSFCLREI